MTPRCGNLEYFRAYCVKNEEINIPEESKSLKKVRCSVLYLKMNSIPESVLIEELE